MKRITLTLFYQFILFTAFCQDFKTADKLFYEGKYDLAKKAIDATPADKPEVLLLKHKIYYKLGTSVVHKGFFPGILLQGWEALKTGYHMPKGDEAALKVIGFTYLNDFNAYYQEFIAIGSEKMNADKHREAFENFKAAISVTTYFYEKQIIKNPLDTMLNFYAGYTAMKDNNNEDAEFYFKKIADNNCSGEDLQIGYGWLCNYYLETKKDIPAAKAVFEKGIKFYPKDEYLLSKETAIASASGNPDNVFAVYEKRISSGKAVFADYLGYGAELYDYMFVDKKITNRGNKESRMVEVLNKALALKPASAETNYILGMYYTSIALENEAAIKKITGTGPKEVLKRGDLKKMTNEYSGKSIQYLEAATGLYEAKSTLKATEKDHYKTALQQLLNLYKFNLNTEKHKIVEDKLGKL